MSKGKNSNVTDSEKKAKKFRFATFILAVFLVVFLLAGAAIFEDDITPENLRYLIKYLDFSSAGIFSEEAEIYYNSDPTNEYYVFRGDLALVSENGVSLYDRRGSVVMEDSFSMAEPACIAGEKYFIIYDLGGHQLRIYNSFSLLFEKNFPYVVQSVNLNSHGNFCVVTGEKSYHSAVFVFNNDFEKTYEWFSTDKFAVDASITDKNVLTISTVRVEDGELVSDLLEMKVGKNKIEADFSMAGDLPIAHSTDRDGTLLLTDSALKYIEDGKEVRSTVFYDSTIKKAIFSEELCAMLLDEVSVGVNHRVCIFNRQGEELNSPKFSVTVRDIEIYEDYVFVLTHTELYVIREGEEMKTYAIDGDFADIGILAENRVVLCSDTKAKIKILE